MTERFKNRGELGINETLEKQIRPNDCHQMMGLPRGEREARLSTGLGSEGRAGSGGPGTGAALLIDGPPQRLESF